MTDKTKKIRNKNHEVIKNVMKIVITILFFGIQVLLYFTLFFGINFLKPDYPVVFRIIYGIVQWIGIICVLLMYRRKINNSYKLSWTIFILLCPFLGTMCYLMFGNGRVLSNKKRLKLNNYLNAYKIKKKEIKNLIEEKPDFARISRALYEDSEFPLYKNSHIEFFKDALDKHNDMLEELANAKHYIFMEYFIFGKGKIMNSLLDTLETKGKLGVEIKIMADDIGSILSRDKEIFNRLQNIPNLEFKSYEPLGLDINPRVNYRDHRKICVVDGRVAYTGGDNIADEYIHLRDRFGYWRDNAVKIKGEAVESFVAMFISMWYMCTNDKLDIKKYMLKDNEQIYSNSYVQPFGDGPMNKINPAYHLFMNMITSAKKSLFISTPYFIIDNSMIDAIVEKAKQGVDVRVMIPQIPDKKIPYILTCTHCQTLVEGGVKVYHYTPGFNHAKNIIVDNKYAFAGTINMDYRSLILHFECGVFFADNKCVNDMNKDFIDTCSDCTLFDLEQYKKRNLLLRFLEFILQVVSPLF